MIARGVLAAPSRIDSRFQLSRYSDLVRILAIRNLKLRYRGSILGVYWSLSNPLMMTGVYTVLFGTAFASYYGGITAYVLACFTGLAVVNFFSISTTQALSSVVGNGTLLNKIHLPVSIFPVSVILANVFQLLVGILPVLALVTLVTSGSLINVAALIIPMVALVMVSFGFALFISALYVFFRDLPYLYELLVFVLWMTSPLFYPPQLVPSQIQPYIALNPLATIMGSIRQIALSHHSPNLHQMAACLISGVIAVIVGSVFFAHTKKEFMDLL